MPDGWWWVDPGFLLPSPQLPTNSIRLKLHLYVSNLKKIQSWGAVV